MDSNAFKEIKFDESGETNSTANNTESCETQNSSFKVAGTNLPEKTGIWTKIKNVLFGEVKVELTPHQQKVEDEINEFLYQEVTLKSFIDGLFAEVPITYKGKRIF